MVEPTAGLSQDNSSPCRARLCSKRFFPLWEPETDTFVPPGGCMDFVALFLDELDREAARSRHTLE
jgi:hypothetical protein